ncbi:hypothetical protein NMY22_g18298 [Coprinellus aureogranulatus]|nr:hypothetical protein NMY22_g18298 [Coprinellus aureogranulatus]
MLSDPCPQSSVFELRSERSAFHSTTAVVHSLCQLHGLVSSSKRPERAPDMLLDVPEYLELWQREGTGIGGIRLGSVRFVSQSDNGIVPGTSPRPNVSIWVVLNGGLGSPFNLYPPASYEPAFMHSTVRSSP